MSWIPWTGHVRRQAGGNLALPLMALLAALSGLMAGCAATSTTVMTPTPSLHFILDDNLLTHSRDIHLWLMALGARDGHVAWQRQLEGSSAADVTLVASQPVYRNGLVYVAYRYEHTVDPHDIVYHAVVMALDAATGAVRWQQDAGARTDINGAPVVDGSTAYVSLSVMPTPGQTPSAASGFVEALAIQTGAVRWKRAVDSTPSMVAPANGRVFVIVDHQLTGHLLALNANDGSVAWDFASNALLVGSGNDLNIRAHAPQVLGGRVYAQATERNAVGGTNFSVLALNAGDGSVAWRRQTGGIATSPVFDQGGDTLCISMYNPQARSADILGLATSNGAPRWRINGRSELVSPCVASGSTFYLTQISSAAGNGSVLALNSQDGHQLWKSAVGDFVSPPTIENGMVGVYLNGPPTTQGPGMSTMAVLQASDGKVVWQHDFSGSPKMTLDIEGDLIFNGERVAITGQPGSFFAVTAYTLDTGTRLWTYTLDHHQAN